MSIVPLIQAEPPEPWSAEPPPNRLPEPAPPPGRRRGLWIDPVRLLALIDGLALAAWAGALAHRVRPVLPAPWHPGRAPQVYRDETILLTLLVRRASRLSLEKLADWLARSDDLATALAMPAGGPTIRAAQLSRRQRQLGVWPCFFFLLALVWQLVRLGAVTGREVILDASLLKAW